MHVRVRLSGKPEGFVLVESKLTKIEKFRVLVQDKFNVKPSLQRLFYGGKLLENGYTLHDYNIKLNDVIQLMVRVQTTPGKDTVQNTHPDSKETDKEEAKIEYKDAVSMLYTVGDFVDMRSIEHGTWYEGKIVRIVSDPAAPHPDINSNNEDRANKENDPEIKQLPSNRNTPNHGIDKYIVRKTPKQAKCSQKNGMNKTEDHLLYQVQIKGDYEDSSTYCKLKDIRPRARNVVTPKDLKIGQIVMLNYNFEYPTEKGYWYDFKVSEIISKRRNIFELIGTIYVGPDSIPQNNTKLRLHDKIFAIEEVVPLEDRTEEYNELMKTQPEKRTAPLSCMTCRDNDALPCKDCGCFLCSGKECPEQTILCDECNQGFHMGCLDPVLTELPLGDWYCMYCKRDPNQVVAPGAAKQKKRQITTKRDWGRGMACVGKTKSCSMPPNHFGPIPGIEVGMCWRFRIQLSESGVHRPPVSGIHGRDVEGAYSIVLSGGYEDDVDHGNEFTYTGSGGRDLSGNKRTAEQSCDQRLVRENRALARNCAVKAVNEEEGDDAGEDWREGRPVRVVRSCKMLKHFPKYAPKEGNRYDGIYKVVKYYPEKGKSGFRVWKYLLRRDDPSPAPWEAGAKHYDIIYPDGYLEAEAEKKAIKEKSKYLKGKGRQPTKRLLQQSNHSANDDTSLPKKQKASEGDEACETSTRSTNDDTSSLAENEKASEFDEASETSNHSANYDTSSLAKNQMASEGDEACEPSRATLTRRRPAKTSQPESPKSPPNTIGINDLYNSIPTCTHKTKPGGSGHLGTSTLSKEVTRTIALDTLNAPLWRECLEVCAEKGNKDFVEYVSNMFLCTICQQVTASSVTTPCRHNFCHGCLKKAFKATGSQVCPCCRRNLSTVDLEINTRLTNALRAVMPGYDANRT